jgi:hypothetical protein
MSGLVRHEAPHPRVRTRVTSRKVLGQRQQRILIPGFWPTSTVGVVLVGRWPSQPP